MCCCMLFLALFVQSEEEIKCILEMARRPDGLMPRPTVLAPAPPLAQVQFHTGDYLDDMVDEALLHPTPSDAEFDHRMRS